MGRFTQMQYEYALERIEDLLPLVNDETDPGSKEALELSLMSDVVIEYEKEHFPIEKPSPAELIELALEEKVLRSSWNRCLMEVVSAPFFLRNAAASNVRAPDIYEKPFVSITTLAFESRISSARR